jgi:hypothetical protein
MAQVAILSGIYTDMTADFRTSYPVNLVPVPKDTGLASGYLRTADGLTQYATGFGVDRGGINWQGVHYRVSGEKLITVAQGGAVSAIGDIAGSDQVSFAYSFDRLAIAANGSLYYFKGGALTKVTDQDFGLVNDVIWVDGYFMTTDGENLVVTELNDPTQVDPLKYGSSEINPDPVIGLIKPLDEVYAMNRYTIEVFDNVGGTGFPFQRISGASINCGLVGKNAKAMIGGTVGFVGSRENEPPSVYLISGNAAQPISTREIDEWLAAMHESTLSNLIVESRKHDVHEHLYIHGADGTAVYDLSASQALQTPIWFWLSTGTGQREQYRAKNFVYVNGRWCCGDKLDNKIGYVDQDTPTQYGNPVAWVFGTTFIYNEGRGAIVNRMELANLAGRAGYGVRESVFASWTDDGLRWSDEKPCAIGLRGDFANRLVWLRVGSMRNYRSFKFRAANKAHIAIARLEMELEPLYV